MAEARSSGEMGGGVMRMREVEGEEVRMREMILWRLEVNFGRGSWEGEEG